MELLSRDVRDGQPMACAYGCESEDSSVRAGLLFVRKGAPDALIFDDPDTGRALRLMLPADYVGMTEDGWGTDEELRAEP